MASAHGRHSDSITPEAADVTTYHLAFRDPAAADASQFRPGQFSMLYLPGVGRSADRRSAATSAIGSTWSYTVRVAGNYDAQAGATRSRAIRSACAGPLDRAGRSTAAAVRTWYSWPAAWASPPLRPAHRPDPAESAEFGRVTLIYGARTPDTLVYGSTYAAWSRGGIERANDRRPGTISPGPGNVGVVPLLVDRLRPFDPPANDHADLRAGSDDALHGAQCRGARPVDRAGLGCPWNATCNVRSVCADIASSARIHLQGRTGLSLRSRVALVERRRTLSPTDRMNAKPKLAVFKFASCDGCQLSLLDCEDELLAVAGRLDIVAFSRSHQSHRTGALRHQPRRGFDHHGGRCRADREVRRNSKFLVTIGACATAGGIQALRNWADTPEYVQAVYARPEYISTLATSTAIAEHVPVDFELRGCPIDKHQLLEVIAALLAGRRPRTPSHSVCLDCKRRGTVCVMVAGGLACLGPVTHAGCGAICPAYDRGCYGCFGPAGQPNLVSLTDQLQANGLPRRRRPCGLARHQRLRCRVPRRGRSAPSVDPETRTTMAIRTIPSAHESASKP